LQVVTFNTVEDFWAVHNHIELSSHLVTGCDYSVFKDGIKPMWEDKANMNGGRWLMNLDKKHRTIYLDNFWLEILLCLIGMECIYNTD
jgi:translation initiation factor 4E